MVKRLGKQKKKDGGKSHRNVKKKEMYDVLLTHLCKLVNK